MQHVEAEEAHVATGDAASGRSGRTRVGGRVRRDAERQPDGQREAAHTVGGREARAIRRVGRRGRRSARRRRAARSRLAVRVVVPVGLRAVRRRRTTLVTVAGAHETRGSS